MKVEACWAEVTASAVVVDSSVASVVFELDGVPVPSTEVTQAGETWTFLFVPDQNGEHNYLIEVTATDDASNTARRQSRYRASKRARR